MTPFCCDVCFFIVCCSIIGRRIMPGACLQIFRRTSKFFSQYAINVTWNVTKVSNLTCLYCIWYNDVAQDRKISFMFSLQSTSAKFGRLDHLIFRTTHKINMQCLKSQYSWKSISDITVWFFIHSSKVVAGLKLSIFQ